MARRLSLVGGYVSAALALAVFWWLQEHHLLAATPYWILITFLVISCAADGFGRFLQHLWPDSLPCARFRLAMAASTTALVLYATGWGSVLIVGFAVGATQVLGRSNQQDWRWAYGCNLCAVAAGEAAIHVGIAPTLIDESLGHAVAAVGLLCLFVVLWILGEALDAARRSHQLVLDREESLVLLATTDPLTGLPNRTLFNDRLEKALKGLGESDGYVAAMVVDLDGFKNVNDSLGHPAGDALLVAVSDRFRTYLRGFDTIARVGGDEFAILVDDVSEPEGAERIAERILLALREPFELPAGMVAIGASVGIALATRADTEPRTILGQADAAMYRAKREGKGCYRLFEHAMQTAAFERLSLEQELRLALSRREITAHYQPIIDLATGQILGFEALARWPHATRGFVRPDEFIPVAEEAGLVLELGQAVLVEACQWTRRWWDAVPGARPTIAVNVSRVQLADPSFVADVIVALADAGLEPSTLILEVTESVLARDSDHISARLEELREIGIRVAIDDFGTGYSSFAALADLPIDILKIDKRFVDNLGNERGGLGFVKAIMQLAQTLGLETVAEGVEQAKQRSTLADLGCDQIQGYLIAPPMPGDTVADYLTTFRETRPLIDLLLE